MNENAPLGNGMGVLFNSRFFASILYLMISLPLGIIYFTVAITGIALSIGLAPIFVGIPLFFAVAKVLNGIVSFEQNMIRHLLGLPTYSITYMSNEQVDSRHNWFMRMVKDFDGALFIRNFLLVLIKFVTSIVFFVIMVTLIALGIGLLALPVVHIILMNEIQVDILESSLFSLLNIDWSYNQQYMFYIVIGLMFSWVTPYVTKGLIQIQSTLMNVDQPYQPAEPVDPQVFARFQS